MTIPFFNFFLQGIIERGHFGIFSDQKDFFHPKNKKYKHDYFNKVKTH